MSGISAATSRQPINTWDSQAKALPSDTSASQSVQQSAAELLIDLDEFGTGLTHLSYSAAQFNGTSLEHSG